MQRQSRGEPPLPEEDLSKLFKPHQAPARMDSLLIAGGAPRRSAAGSSALREQKTPAACTQEAEEAESLEVLGR